MDALEPMDQLMLAGEIFGSAMHVGILLILTPPDDADEGFVDALYADSLTGSYELDPRLSRHPHRGLDTGGIWVWRNLTEVDLPAHLHRATLPAGSGIEELWTLVSALHSERLEMSSPLWASCLIDGLDDGRFAIYIKVHHIVIDGVGGLRMISDALSTDPGRRSMPPFYAANSADAPMAHTRHRGLPNPFGAVRAVANAAAAGLDLTRRVATAELANVLGSLVSDAVVAPLEAPQTRFNTKLGPHRVAAGTSLQRARIGAIAESAGVTGNDVVTALIAGALRTWLIGEGELPKRTLVAMCPVSVRTHDTAGATQGGNQFGLGLCPLGTDIEDPVERLTLIHDAMSNIKHQVSSKGSDAMLAVMGPAIGSTVGLALLPFGAVVPPSCNLAISNVPGPREEMYFNGARVDEIYPVSTAFDGMGLNVTVCSYADRLQVGYVTDAAVMGDVGALVPLTEQALTELETVLGLTQ
ncbi:MAG: wax ester/triacylglycerol synthase family O-acyltransferase [Mycobacterium sp.]